MTRDKQIEVNGFLKLFTASFWNKITLNIFVGKYLLHSCLTRYWLPDPLRIISFVLHFIGNFPRNLCFFLICLKRFNNDIAEK